MLKENLLLILRNRKNYLDSVLEGFQDPVPNLIACSHNIKEVVYLDDVRATSFIDAYRHYRWFVYVKDPVDAISCGASFWQHVRNNSFIVYLPSVLPNYLKLMEVLSVGHLCEKFGIFSNASLGNETDIVQCYGRKILVSPSLSQIERAAFCYDRVAVLYPKTMCPDNEFYVFDSDMIAVTRRRVSYWGTFSKFVYMLPKIISRSSGRRIVDCCFIADTVVSKEAVSAIEHALSSVRKSLQLRFYVSWGGCTDVCSSDFLHLKRLGVSYVYCSSTLGFNFQKNLSRCFSGEISVPSSFISRVSFSKIP